MQRSRTARQAARAVGQDYGMIYRVERLAVTVVPVASGIKKERSRGDIDRVAAKLLRLGLL